MKLTTEQFAAATALGDGPRPRSEVDPRHLQTLVDARLLEVNGDHVRLCRPLWAIQHFPQPGNAEEIGAWKPYVVHRALHMCVLCAATTRVEGVWTAYCRNVPGSCHMAEVQRVLDDGDKLSEPVARAMFPEFHRVPYGR